MQHITIIVAADLNNAIGKKGNLPWHLPQDLKFFKHTTWAMPVIMGRKTFESLGKPLPGRTNIVVTTNKDWKQDDVWVAHDIETAIRLAESLKTREIFIIGGGTIYEASLSKINRVYITRVDARIEEADTWFPELDENEWERVWQRPFEADEKHAFAYIFQCWERIKGNKE